MKAIDELKKVVVDKNLTTEQKHSKIFYDGLADKVRTELGSKYYPEEGCNLSEIVDFCNVVLCKSRDKSLNGGW